MSTTQEISKLEEFAQITCLLVGHDKPIKFIKNECDLNIKWDDGDSKQSILNELTKSFEEKLKNVDNLNIGRKEYNQLLLLMGCLPVSDYFFNQILGQCTDQEYSIKNLDDYRDKVLKFAIKSAFKFGNLKYSFRYFSGIKQPKTTGHMEIENSVKETWKSLNLKKEDLENDFKKRKPEIKEIENIDKKHRKYISEINKLESGDSEYDTYINTKNIARRNSALYLTRDYMDVYVATSMRTNTQFKDVADKIEQIFKSDELGEIKESIRYFDPTLGDCPENEEGNHDSRFSKSLIESLMLKRCKLTLYLAQESDSLGKDSELSITLSQGKPVIAYVPEIDVESKKRELTNITNKNTRLDILKQYKSIFLKYLYKDNYKIISKNIINIDEDSIGSLWNQVTQDEVINVIKEFYDERAKLLKDIHPLGLQVNLQTGVANGLIVVRNEDDAAKLIYEILTNSVKYQIEYEPNNDGGIHGQNISIVEETTKSVVRFISGDDFLTKSFWANYLDLKRHE